MPIPAIDVTKYLGRTWARDFNCWDLVREVYSAEFGIDLAPHEIAVATAIHAADSEVQVETAKTDIWTQVCTPEPGDLALFGKRFNSFHVGLVLTQHTNGVVPCVVLHMTAGAQSSAVPLSRISAKFTTTTFYRHGPLHNRYQSADPS